MTLKGPRYKHYLKGEKLKAKDYNSIVAAVEKVVASMLGNGLMDVTGLQTRRIPSKADVSSNTLRKAYCKDDAGAATTIDCFLDVDTTGPEIEVNFEIAGGGNTNAAIPRLSDGDLIWVTQDSDGDWHCVTTLQASEDCVCSA